MSVAVLVLRGFNRNPTNLNDPHRGSGICFSLSPCHDGKKTKTKDTHTMKDYDKFPNSPSEKVIEHPKLKRDRAFALFLARSHAHRYGKPPPDSATINPAVFTRLTPEMSREQRCENLIPALERMGIKVDRDK